jgi:hypothetical protein
VAVEVQRVGCEVGDVSKYSAQFARKIQWLDAEAEQPCRVTEAEVADMVCAGKNDQRTRQLDLSGGGHIAAWPNALARRAVRPCGFSVASNYCFVAFAAFAAFSTASSAASLASDAAFVAALRLLRATSTACFVAFCTLS